MYTKITVQDGDTLKTLREFLKLFLEKDIVEGLFVPLETNAGTVVPALVIDPTQLARANPLAPIMPINNARAVSALTGKQAPIRLGAVLRPCEMRALIELVKLQQASLEGVILIGIDCPGTYEVSEYYKMQANGEFKLEDHLAAAQNGHEITSEGLSMRNACQICVQQIPTETAAVRIHIFGADLHTEIPVELDEEFAEKLGVQPQGLAEETGRKNTLEKIVNSHRQVREKELLTIKTRMNSNGGIAGLFETCIRCHNCMTVCPICYCKTCLFRTSSFDHPPEHYLGAARRKGAVRLPGDTLLFHLTRMNHMSASCVSCGMCTSACPSDIQVGSIFSAVGEQVQAVFDYVPGRNLDEPLPLVTFQADEWTQVGEAR